MRRICGNTDSPLEPSGGVVLQPQKRGKGSEPMEWGSGEKAGLWPTCPLYKYAMMDRWHQPNRLFGLYVLGDLAVTKALKARLLNDTCEVRTSLNG